MERRVFTRMYMRMRALRCTRMHAAQVYREVPCSNSRLFSSSIEDIYQKKTPIEHVLLRPGMYIGSTAAISERLWVFRHLDPVRAAKSHARKTKAVAQAGTGKTKAASVLSSEAPSALSLLQREIAFVPGLYKIFDEIIVNAADNKQRDPTHADTIRVVIKNGQGKGRKRQRKGQEGVVQADADGPVISVYNNGQGIPVVKHKEENVYVPELVLGSLLTGSNFNDEGSSSSRGGRRGKGGKKALTGGRHGYGAKLTNIFSTKFTVETADAKRGLLYTQTWKNNMSSRGKEIVTPLQWHHCEAAMNDQPLLVSDVIDVGADSANQTKSPNANKLHDFTRITFSPDMTKFDADSLTSTSTRKAHTNVLSTDMLHVMYKRVWDVAGCNASSGSNQSSDGNGGHSSRLQVYLNGDLIPIDHFTEYCSLFSSQPSPSLLLTPAQKNKVKKATPTSNSTSLPMSYAKFGGQRWEVAVSSPDSSAGAVGASSAEAHHVSFVNSMNTLRGGTHVDHISHQVATALARTVNRQVERKMQVRVTPQQAKQHFNLYVNCLVENPTFDSQMKECLQTPHTQFGSNATLPKRYLSQIVDTSGVVEKMVEWVTSRQKSALARSIGANKNTSKKKLLAIPKLEDANWAGTKDYAEKCTLILTEGDSAKALAVAGLETVGRDTFGVFPLRGKLLNVRDATVKQIRNNAEVVNLFQILGLDMSKSYANLDVPLSEQGLRYGRVMIMADQDYDGSHIKGLVLNLFHHFFPHLLARPGFLSEFITPMLKARSSNGKEEKVFFGMEEFKAWYKTIDNGGNDEEMKENMSSKSKKKKWNIKYYKGLGTSTAKEAKEYFGELEKHHIFFRSQWAQERSPFLQWKEKRKKEAIVNHQENNENQEHIYENNDNNDKDKDVLGGDGHFIDMAFNKKRSEDRRKWILNSHSNGNTNAALAVLSGLESQSKGGEGGEIIEDHQNHFTIDLDPFLDVKYLENENIDSDDDVNDMVKQEKKMFAQWLSSEITRAQKSETADDYVDETTAKNSITTPASPSLMRQFYTYRDFINKELILFSNMDNMRSIPSTIDGLKPSQRKVLFACFKRKLTAEIKVAQLAGYVSEHTAYHHGEQSLHSTIISMAQDFVGSNNIPLLAPSGQFGTRLQGGKDAASARYIFTQLSEVTRELFPEADDAVLNYLVEDGQPIEPDFYVPVLPVLLINGSDGIGTGWSTSVPQYNPHDLIENALIFCREMEREVGIERKKERGECDSEEGEAGWVNQSDIDRQLLTSSFLRDPNLSVLKEMIPWTHGWRGEVEPTFTASTTTTAQISDNVQKRIWKSKGVVENVQIHSPSSATFEITELPLGRWTEDMKTILNDLTANGCIKRYEEHHTEREVHFIVHCNQPTVEALKKARTRIKEGVKNATKKTETKKKKSQAKRSKAQTAQMNEDMQAAFESIARIKEGVKNATKKTKTKKKKSQAKRSKAQTAQMNEDMQAAFQSIIWDTVALKMESNISENNIHSFDRNHRIHKSEDPREIVAQHAAVRMELYGKRKEHQLRTLRKELRKLRNRARFAAEMAEKGGKGIDGNVDESMRLRNRILGQPKSALAAEMVAAGFDTEKMLDEEEEDYKSFSSSYPQTPTVNDFKYLLKTSLWNFTQESVERLQQQKVDRENDMKKLEGTSVVELWRQDLKSIRDHLDGDPYQEQD